MRTSRLPFVLVGIMTSSAWSYETGTHDRMSEQAAARSLLRPPAMFQRLGLLGSLNGGGGLIFPSSEHREDEKRDERSPVRLIRFGSMWEDDRKLTQALRHFFNPRTGKALTADTVVGSLSGETSPAWAVDGGSANQPFSYKKAREYYYDALTNTLGPVDRKKAWGMTFQTLGHIMHHLQDMALPAVSQRVYHTTDAL